MAPPLPSSGGRTMMMEPSTSSSLGFAIPSALQDLEREPHQLDPYPDDFRTDDPHGSFDTLVQLVENGNPALRFLAGNGGNTNRNDNAQTIFEDEEEDNDNEDETIGDEDSEGDGSRAGNRAVPPPTRTPKPFIEPDRFQALYTLVRKSTSLEGPTNEALVAALCTAVRNLCTSLQHRHQQQRQTTPSSGGGGGVVSQSFRDSLACHVYFLYSYVVLMEQHQSQQALLSDDGKDAASVSATATLTKLRKRCVDALLEVATTLATCRTTLWVRGVVGDESVVLLPCRAAYRLLEKSKGVLARKAACGDEALRIVSVTLQQSSSSTGGFSYHTTITAALIDLMHSYEHMAGMASEVASTNDRLAIELLRELSSVGQTVKEHHHTNNNNHHHKASGIALAAPFLPHLAAARPKLVLQHAASYVIPLLQAECYQLRSAVVQTLAHLLEYLGQQQHQQQQNHQSQPQGGSADEGSTAAPHDSDGFPSDRLAGDATKTRDALLDLLAERAYDVSSFTRAASLKAWMALSNSKALPKTRLLAATQLAMDRLQDKTVVVRKQAMQLLTTLLENHPFLESLDPKPYRDKLQDLYDWVKAHLPENIHQAHEDNLQALNPEEHDDTYQAERLELEQAALSAALAEADALLSDQGAADQLSPAQQEYCNKVQALKFTQSALDFIDTLENATTALESMLLSASTSDVVEALRFFVQARHFQLPCAVTGMKRALALLWSTEQAIRDEVLKSFVDVFVAVPGTDGQELLSDQIITQNLLLLTGQASVSELASIEEAVQRLVQAETIPPNVFLMLWSIASKGSSDARAAAVRLLSMGASADRSIVDSKSRLKLLLDAGFGKYSRKHRDWRLVGAAAVALQKVERATVDPTDAKYLVQERLLEQLQVVARGEWCDDTEADAFEWFPAAEQAVKAIFAVSPEPERMGRSVLLQMYQSTFHDASAVNPVRLARFFHVLGQVSLELLVYTESLCGSVRRANSKKSMQRQEDADKAKAAKRGTSGRNDDDEDSDNAIEAELGIAAEVEAENEREMSEISEQEIVGRGLIGQFVPMLTQVVANEGQRFGQVQIMSQAAMLALAKIMCVSSKFCESHLGLLFTALSNAPAEDTTMRANTVVALGDLAFRFPNEVEPYTPHLYACLRDPSTKVRRHTLMVTTHLILNDMIRVKGQVSEIALCLRDDDPRIRDMSRLLFHELSKRTNNPVYNLLPDIISTLGSSDAVRKEDFRSIMSFLLGFIKKDRQNEMLVDKLLHRFPVASSVSHKADLTFCIAQLKMSEKSLKCLNEQFKLYEDALHDDDVSKQFLSIASKAKKKFATGDTRALVDDWEAKLTQAATRGAENEAADEDAARASGKARRQKKVTSAKSKTTAKKPAVASIPEGSETEDEEEDLAFPEETQPRSTKKSARKQQRPRSRRPVKRIVVEDDDDSGGSPSANEDSDASVEKENAPQMRADPTPPPPPRRRPRPARGQASATH